MVLVRGPLDGRLPIRLYNGVPHQTCDEYLVGEYGDPSKAYPDVSLYRDQTGRDKASVYGFK
jgi:hypothetical protein